MDSLDAFDDAKCLKFQFGALCSPPIIKQEMDWAIFTGRKSGRQEMEECFTLSVSEMWHPVNVLETPLFALLFETKECRVWMELMYFAQCSQSPPSKRKNKKKIEATLFNWPRQKICTKTNSIASICRVGHPSASLSRILAKGWFANLETTCVDSAAF